MTCHHGPNDSSCSSHPNYVPPKPYEPPTPDAERYEVVAMERYGRILVLKVKYPNCAQCAYEGTKILVYQDISEMDLVSWKRIDPHFRGPKGAYYKREAPSPLARFPASDDGWQDALDYASAKSKTEG